MKKIWKIFTISAHKVDHDSLGKAKKGSKEEYPTAKFVTYFK
jgi:hypothetical protein